MTSKEKVVVLSGAGISAESGIATFRDANGLWEGHDVTEVASPGGWKKNPKLVLNFYNERRKNAASVSPNKGHLALVQLESKYDVTIITQNVDNLHEQAGSSHVLHLHGELFKSRSTVDPSLVYDMEGTEINLGDTCEKGSQLRPHIVWFGEAVPMINVAMEISMQADYYIVVGTSLNVYPAAGLIDYAVRAKEIFVVDPNIPAIEPHPQLHLIESLATIGLPLVVNQLME